MVAWIDKQLKQDIKSHFTVKCVHWTVGRQHQKYSVYLESLGSISEHSVNVQNSRMFFF